MRKQPELPLSQKAYVLTDLLVPLWVTVTGRIVCSSMFSLFFCGTLVGTVLTLTVSSFGFFSSVPPLTSSLLAKPSSCNNVGCVPLHHLQTLFLRHCLEKWFCS